MSIDVVSFTTSAAVATAGTVTVNYPANRTAGNYRAVGHTAQARGLMAALALGSGFTMTFGTSNMTFTYKGTTSIPAGTLVTLELDLVGSNDGVEKYTKPSMPRVGIKQTVSVALGSPAAASSTFLAASQGITTPVAAVLAATTPDVPRNVVAAWTTTAILTITGTDEYGAVMTEVSASGTSHIGSKAFKTITSMTLNATVTAFTAGTGVKLGLPVFVDGAGYILSESQDGAAATAGTLVGGNVTAPPTSSTGDARGTYTANAAPDGSKKYVVVVAIDDNTYLGLGQA